MNSHISKDANKDAPPEKRRKFSGKNKALLTTGQGQKCIMCPENHALFKCPKFLVLSISDRIQKVRKASLCYNCLKRSVRLVLGKCPDCDGKHNRLLHLPKKSTNNDASTSKTTGT